MKRKQVLLLTLILSSSLFPISGCADSRCMEARLEADKSLETSSALEIKRKNLERKLWYEYSEYCDGLRSEKSPLDDSFEQIYCRSWEEMGRPAGTVTMNNGDYAELSDKISEAKNRWAITVTSYEDCFEPSQVIAGEEILRG